MSAAPGEVHFRDVSYRDLSLKRVVPEQLSPNYRMLRLTPFYYSFASGAADFDRDGNMDIVSGPFIFLGPDFTKVREFYMALTTNPSTSFSSNWLEFAGDFTGDGWPDVLLASTSDTRLYVNPKGEPRRWDSHLGVVPPAPNVSEVSAMKDIDADGKPDLVYASAGAVRWAKPDPANPTGPWLSTQVGEAGTYAAHGIGAGDINGDGRVGHPERLRMVGAAREGHDRDVDVPSSGLRPSERPRSARRRRDVRVRRQRRQAQRRRDVAAGARVRARVVRAEARCRREDLVRAAHDLGRLRVEERRRRRLLAAARLGLRRYDRRRHARLRHRQTVLLAQRELPPIPIRTAHAVLYVYRTVRNKQAPGGAEFVPELVHNQSGAGSQVLAVDLNKDGVMDLVTSGELGAFAFLGQPRAKK